MTEITKQEEDQTEKCETEKWGRRPDRKMGENLVLKFSIFLSHIFLSGLLPHFSVWSSSLFFCLVFIL